MKEPFEAIGTFLYEHKHSVVRGVATWVGTEPLAEAAAHLNTGGLKEATLYYLAKAALGICSVAAAISHSGREEQIRLEKEALPHHTFDNAANAFRQNANTLLYVAGAVGAMATHSADMALATANFLMMFGGVNMFMRYMGQNHTKMTEYKRIINQKHERTQETSGPHPTPYAA